MTTDGANVYHYNPDDGGSIVSCPISSLGDGCQSLGLTNLPESYPRSMAASPDYLYLGYGLIDKTGYIYRCPLDVSSDVCVQFDDAGNRKIYSLVLANGRLYAGLGKQGGTEDGLIWNCDPITANSCEDFDKPEKIMSMRLQLVLVPLVIYGPALVMVLSGGVVWMKKIRA